MQTRYGTELHTPGRQTLGKPEIKRYDEDIQAQFNGILQRRRELATRAAAVNSESDSIMAGLGAWVAEGCDWREYTDRLQELRAEAEAIGAALAYLGLEADKLKRLNTWLTNR